MGDRSGRETGDPHEKLLDSFFSEEAEAAPGPPAPPEQDAAADLVIVRDMADEMALAESSAAQARPEPDPDLPLVTPKSPSPDAGEAGLELEIEPRLPEAAPEQPVEDEPAAVQEPALEEGPWLSPPSAEVPGHPARKPSAVRRPEPPVGALVAAVGSLGVLAAATLLAAMGVEAVRTWYYPLAWYPFLLLVNYVTAVRSREHSVFLGRGRAMLALLAWSVPAWLFFEVWNLRLQNWYYVGVPQSLLARWLGVVVSFATVLPGVLLVEEMLWVRGAFVRARTRPFPWSPFGDRALLIAGGVCAALVLAWPGFFFPLVWGIPVLLLEPWLRRGPGPSLVRDLMAGRPGRIYRLLAAGMICGLWWEAANTFAGGRWIYTVPGLDGFRPFEMPLFGFLGFAPFALCLWAMAQSLVRLGLLPDWEHVSDARRPVPTTPLALNRARQAMAAAGVASILALVAMDRWTVDSFHGRAADVPGIPEGVPEYARLQGKDSVRGVLWLVESGELHIPGGSTARLLSQLGQTCRLTLLRDIGTQNAARLHEVGVMSISDLAGRESAELTEALDARGEPGWRPVPRRVAIWVRAARDAASAGR